MEPFHAYSEEDWLVHAFYGLGQIKGTEVKAISGAKVRYFRIQTADSTYWIPVEQMDSDVMRPVASPAEIQLAIAVLQRPAVEMSSDHNVRKNRIRRVQLENTPENIARLIRDLRARQRDKGKYNLDENNVIRTLKQRLVDEWSIVTGKQKEKVASRLDDLLDYDQESTEG